MVVLVSTLSRSIIYADALSRFVYGTSILATSYRLLAPIDFSYAALPETPSQPQEFDMKCYTDRGTLCCQPRQSEGVLHHVFGMLALIMCDNMPEKARLEALNIASVIHG